MARADFVVYGIGREIVLLVEIKARSKATTAHWAAETRRNILQASALPETTPFLLVSMDNMYLWHEFGQANNVTAPALPTSQFDTARALDGLLPPSALSGGLVTISETSLAFAVDAWLNAISMADQLPQDESGTGRAWLEGLGMLSRIKGGVVVREPML